MAKANGSARGLLIAVSIALLLFICSYQTNSLDNFASTNRFLKPITFIADRITDQQQEYYAVFSTNIPAKVSSHFAFYMPLTVLAWERLGFKSIVPLIGSRQEWSDSPVLQFIVSHLTARRATVLYVDSPRAYSSLLSQNVRLFVTNLDGFPGRDSDYLVTSDGDLWPLLREHVAPRGQTKKLVLINSDGWKAPFTHNGSNYLMQPMSHVGAPVAYWREMVNNEVDFPPANDAESMVSYLERFAGPSVRKPFPKGTPLWYLDQHVLSVRMAQLIENRPEYCTHKTSNLNLNRLNRINWQVDLINATEFQTYYDTHLPLDPLADWPKIVPLLNLMFGNQSWQYQWANDYYTGYKELITKLSSRSQK